jgi:hypothetical protein
MLEHRLQRLASLALALWVCSGCNLVLDNEKRSLSQRAVEPTAHDAGAPVDAAADGGESEAGLRDGSADLHTCGSNPFPECTPGAIDMGTQACGDCGAGTQTRMRGCTIECRLASWSPWSDCQEPADICKPGMAQEMMEACGECGLGMRKTTRSCMSSCGWSDWSPQSCSGDESACHPGAILKLADVGCGTMCGHASQTQTCNARCGWDPMVTGMCTSEGMCKPGTTRMAAAGGCNANYCNKGVQQQMETCTQGCAWGTPTAAAGGCTIPSNVCRPMDLGGMGSRCRPNDSGYRESCSNSTAGASACTWGGRQADSSCD